MFRRFPSVSGRAGLAVVAEGVGGGAGQTLEHAAQVLGVLKAQSVELVVLFYCIQLDNLVHGHGAFSLYAKIADFVEIWSNRGQKPKNRYKKP